MKEGLEQAWQQAQEGIEPQVNEPAVEQEVINEVTEVYQDETPQREDSVPEVSEEATGSLETIIEETPIVETPSRNLPENVDKLVDFLNENPGANLQDYINLNKSFDDFDDKAILTEFYQKTKPHLDSEDISYLINEKFNYDPEDDSSRGKQIALKEELSNAKGYLNTQKDKYYADLKVSGGSAADSESAQLAEQATQHFLAETNKVFEGLDSFTFDLGDKKLKYNLQDPAKVKENQSDLNNLIGRFVNEDGLMVDAEGYHKAFYVAANHERLLKMAYQQGAADTIENGAKNSKNIDFSSQNRPASSDTKLKPGQAREINTQQSTGPRVNIRWNK